MRCALGVHLGFKAQLRMLVFDTDLLGCECGHLTGAMFARWAADRVRRLVMDELAPAESGPNSLQRA